MTTYRNTLLFVLLTHLTGCISEGSTKCSSLRLRSGKISENEVPYEYTCPKEFDPKSFTECCNDGNCCEGTFLSMAPRDDWVLMVTAILVITSCIVLTIVIVICCFWSKCPLYNTCRANYNMSNVIIYSFDKGDPAPLMPGEGKKGDQYKPCTVKIKKMQEV